MTEDEQSGGADSQFDAFLGLGPRVAIEDLQAKVRGGENIYSIIYSVLEQDGRTFSNPSRSQAHEMRRNPLLQEIRDLYELPQNITPDVVRGFQDVQSWTYVFFAQASTTPGGVLPYKLEELVGLDLDSMTDRLSTEDRQAVEAVFRNRNEQGAQDIRDIRVAIANDPTGGLFLERRYRKKFSTPQDADKLVGALAAIRGIVKLDNALRPHIPPTPVAAR